MKKRIIALTLALMMLISILPTAAFAADPVQITIGNVTANAGETISVPVTISGASNAKFANMIISFSVPSGLSISSAIIGTEAAAAGMTIADTSNYSAGIIIVKGNAATGCSPADGTLLTLQVKLDATATGAYTITGGPKDDNAGNISDCDEENVVCTFTSGTITVGSSGGETPSIPTNGAYTAALNITETAVRAGGNTVNVTVNVTHSNDSTFNAAELKVKYDPALLTPVTTGLAADTFKVDSTNGILTIEDYGANKNLGYTYNLAFTTCASVTADTTSTITLQSAAFADKADAVASDLIPATLAPSSDTVTIQREAFDVEIESNENDGDTVINGKTEAVKGDDYQFSVTKDEHYTYEVTATVNDSEVTVTESTAEPGKYTIAGNDVTGPIKITVTATAHQYDVTFSGESPAANDGAKATHDSDYHFTLPTIEQHQVNYTITIGGSAYTGATASANVITIPGSDITGAIAIKITKTQTEFNITVVGSDYAIEDEDKDGNYEKGEAVKITVTPAEGYTYTVSAVKTGTEETVTVTNNGDNTYTIANLQNDLTITVTKTLIGTVEVAPYLTLDATNTENPSLSMFLVTYTGNPAEGYTPYCNDGVMYWSSQYNAYCYLVIATDLETAKNSVQVSVKNGNKSEITYTMNVNGSTNTDAADAQLVYDMYQAEYKEFQTVSMLKFLLADVNNSKTVTTEDAAAIISAILAGTAQ